MTTRTRTNGLPTMTRSETAAWISLARTGRLHAAINRPDWPEMLAALAIVAEAARTQALAALSTRTPTRTGPARRTAPQVAPSRPSKR